MSKTQRQIVPVTMSDYFTENLRASPDLLRPTVLPYGWDDEFNTEGFCANDLFVVSV